MRKFEMINGIGQTVDLMDRTAFFHAPRGLGFKRNVTSVQAGSSFFETKNTVEQMAVYGEMVFAGYAQYDAFRRALAHTPLRLRYCPDNKWFQTDCVCTQLDKGEISTSGSLVCAICLMRMSPWMHTVRATQEVAAPNTKVYPYSYGYTYVSAGGGAFTYKNHSGRDAALRLSIFGPAINPRWSVTAGGKVVSSGKISVEIAIGEKAVVDSSEAGMEMTLYTNENVFVKDLYPDGDFSTERFCYAPPGESIIAFDHEGTGDLETVLEVTEYADTV